MVGRPGDRGRAGGAVDWIVVKLMHGILVILGVLIAASSYTVEIKSESCFISFPSKRADGKLSLKATNIRFSGHLFHTPVQKNTISPVTLGSHLNPGNQRVGALVGGLPWLTLPHVYHRSSTSCNMGRKDIDIEEPSDEDIDEDEDVDEDDDYNLQDEDEDEDEEDGDDDLQAGFDETEDRTVNYFRFSICGFVFIGIVIFQADTEDIIEPMVLKLQIGSSVFLDFNHLVQSAEPRCRDVRL